MKCPNDNAVLVMSDRQGIEIDYCPQCRGVWLDRGELDKIIDRTPTGTSEVHRQDHIEAPLPQRHSGYSDLNEHHYGSDDYQYKKRKKESFLGDLFDF